MDRESLKPMVMYLVPLVVIVSLILFFGSGRQFQRPIENPEGFPLYMEELNGDLRREDWSNARVTLKKLEASRYALIPGIRYSIGRKQIEELNGSLARVRDAVKVKDKTAALMELAELEKYWNGLGTQT